jgi:hypothetical protein
VVDQRDFVRVACQLRLLRECTGEAQLKAPALLVVVWRCIRRQRSALGSLVQRSTYTAYMEKGTMRGETVRGGVVWCGVGAHCC